MRRILGVDPGIRNCGWAVIEHRPEGPWALVASGRVRTVLSKHTHQQALHLIYDAIARAIAEHLPDAAVIEQIYFSATNSAISTGQVRGVVLLACEQADIVCEDATPQQGKLAAAGHGRADKQQVRAGVCERLGLDEFSGTDHEADAAGLALHLADCLEQAAAED